MATAAVVALSGGAVALLQDREPGRPLAATPSASSPSASPSATATPTPSPTPAPSTVPEARAKGTLPTVKRLRADDRWALSATASRASTPRPGAGVPVVYLVADDRLDLGWAAVPAAAARGGSVLLTRGDRLPVTTKAELERLHPAEVVVLGGTRAVADRVVTTVERVASVTRVDSDDPLAVARAVNRAAFPTATTAWVASAGRATDLAVAAATAASRRSPLVVVAEGARSLPAADAALLGDLGVRDATVVGGTKAVSSGVADALDRALGGEVTRAEGADRAALAARTHTMAWGRATAAAAYVANGDRVTDAFTGAVLAGRVGVPLYWSLVHCLPAATREGVLADTVARVTVLGGEGSVRSLVDDLTPCRSTEDPSSQWVLVNKRNGLSPRSFVPKDLKVVPMEHSGGHQLRADAADALAAMARGSREAGAGTVGIDTAFRSYETQDALYTTWLARRGRTWADTWYLRPGFSEHQTGLTVDLLPIGRSSCTINDCIDETPQGAWLARNAWRYGFILRYERGHTSTTGVGFEPWHFRYVGTDLARAYREGGWHTYEEFLGRPAAPTY